jgi:hypothetical protein
MPTKKSSELSIEILAEEFEYIASTANQTNEDRARVSSFYLVTVGSLVAALFSTQLLDQGPDNGTLYLIFSGLLLVLTLLGTLTVLQLARLRAAWHESIRAMNQIKDYAISQDKDLAKAFRWRENSMPSLYKSNSVSFQQTLEVAMLSGLTFGAAVYFLQMGIQYNCFACNWAYTIAGGLFAFFLQLFLYKRQLTQKRK